MIGERVLLREIPVRLGLGTVDVGVRVKSCRLSAAILSEANLVESVISADAGRVEIALDFEHLVAVADVAATVDARLKGNRRELGHSGLTQLLATDVYRFAFSHQRGDRSGEARKNGVEAAVLLHHNDDVLNRYGRGQRLRHGARTVASCKHCNSCAAERIQTKT